MIKFQDNTPTTNVRYVLFSVDDTETDKLHVIRQGISAADMVLRAAGLGEASKLYLYFTTPSKKFTSMGVIDQHRVTKDGRPMQVLGLTPAQLWRLTINKAYAECASLIMALSWRYYGEDAFNKQEMSVYNRMRRMEFDAYDAFSMYVNGVRTLEKFSKSTGDSKFIRMTERLISIQRALAGHFYAFQDYEGAENWPMINTIAVEPGSERYNLQKAREVGKLDIGIAAVYLLPGVK
jgi:hypothetical protein